MNVNSVFFFRVDRRVIRVFLLRLLGLTTLSCFTNDFRLRLISFHVLHSNCGLMNLQLVASATTYSVHKVVFITTCCFHYNIFSNIRFVDGLRVVWGREKLLSCDFLALTHQLNHKLALLVAPTLVIPPESQVNFARLPGHLSSALVEELLSIRGETAVEIGVGQPQWSRVDDVCQRDVLVLQELLGLLVFFLSHQLAVDYPTEHVELVLRLVLLFGQSEVEAGHL